jgi:hypothetical protein
LSAAALPAVSLLAAQPTVAATTAHWHNLRSVSVTVAHPSLPPPGDKPHTTSFTPGHGLRRAERALNRNDITRLAKARQGSPGCAGGYVVAIRIVKHNSSSVKMGGYRCGTTTSGHIGGNLPGFLRSLGVAA